MVIVQLLWFEKIRYKIQWKLKNDELIDREEISLVFFWYNTEVKFISNKSYVE